MRPLFATLALGVALLAPMLAPTPTQAWPNGARAAVVLTYDDAMASQLQTAVPALDAAGLSGVFFLSAVKATDIPAWRAAATNGHELANHTVFHPCLAATFPADPRYTLEAYTPASLLREIEQANVLLTAIDGEARHGFATPCGQTTAGGVDYIEPLRRSGLVRYSRGVTATTTDLATDIHDLDRMKLPSRGFPADATGRDLIAFAEAAVAGGGMAVFLFHGVGGEHLPVSAEAHAELLAWLAARRDTVWTTTLSDAFDWADANPR